VHEDPNYRNAAGAHRHVARLRCLEPFFDQLLTNSGDSHEAGLRRRSDPAVAPSFPCLTCIGLQQDAGAGQLPRRVRATLDQGIQTLSLFRTELHDILLYSNLFRGHESASPLGYRAVDPDIVSNVNNVADYPTPDLLMYAGASGRPFDTRCGVAYRVGGGA
jgi:hypothetical protein